MKGKRKHSQIKKNKDFDDSRPKDSSSDRKKKENPGLSGRKKMQWEK